ncbi:Terpene synthase family%2C metal binding domain [Mycobacterium tuberculosis]|nr:Terpene synthase family%2C metal binding domain [Mycobacterium tuberculosis]
MTETASGELTEPPHPGRPHGQATPALEAGTICAVAGQSQRQMRRWAAEHPALYDAKAFDPALFSTLALAAAFSGPGLTADRLRMANRVCVWCFGLDWLIDYVASSRAEVAGLVRRCADIADGATPAPGDSAEDELARFLADVRDEMAAEPAYPELRDVWRDELRRMLDAMALEWDWKAAREKGEPGPSFEEYLANADNLGFSFVFASHWIASGGGGNVPAVRAASRAVQRVVRLLNDLGTYERDVQWGDLNGLLLDLTRAEVEERIGELTSEARTLLHDVAKDVPELARYMERQMDFCAGFYGVTDFWGTL